MKNYEVKLSEVHYVIWSVEADSEEEAKEKAMQGDGTWESREYSHEYDEAECCDGATHLSKDILLDLLLESEGGEPETSPDVPQA
jgi:hypothetical protein